MNLPPSYNSWKTRSPDIPDDCEYCGEPMDVCRCDCDVCGHYPCNCDEQYDNYRDREFERNEEN